VKWDLSASWLIFFFFSLLQSRKSSDAHSLKSTVSMHAAKLWVIMEKLHREHGFTTIQNPQPLFDE